MTSVTGPLKACTLNQEITSVLEKGTITKVKASEQQDGFYSIYCLVLKKDGGFHPVLDLKWFNVFLKVILFHMLRTVNVLQTIAAGEWFTSLDLKDAYFHVPLLPERMSFQCQAYQFEVLLIGLSLAPHVFTR